MDKNLPTTSEYSIDVSPSAETVELKNDSFSNLHEKMKHIETVTIDKNLTKVSEDTVLDLGGQKGKDVAFIEGIAHLLFCDIETPILIDSKLAETDFSYSFLGRRNGKWDDQVVIKVLKYCGSIPDPRKVTMFMKEAAIHQQVSNDPVNLEKKVIRGLFDFDSIKGAYADRDVSKMRTLHYMVKEYVNGYDFSEILDDNDLLLKEKAEVVRKIAEALEIVHRHGFVHRDIKPENVLCETAGDVKLCDFGMACKEGDHYPGIIAGTPWYLPPEAIITDPSTKLQDIYSLGVIGFHTIEGTRIHPYAGVRKGLKTNDLLKIICSQDRKLATIMCEEANDSGYSKVVQKCLEKSPSKRYQNAVEVIEAIDKCKF